MVRRRLGLVVILVLSACDAQSGSAPSGTSGAWPAKAKPAQPAEPAGPSASDLAWEANKKLFVECEARLDEIVKLAKAIPAEQTALVSPGVALNEGNTLVLPGDPPELRRLKTYSAWSVGDERWWWRPADGLLEWLSQSASRQFAKGIGRSILDAKYVVFLTTLDFKRPSVLSEELRMGQVAVDAHTFEIATGKYLGVVRFDARSSSTVSFTTKTQDGAHIDDDADDRAMEDLRTNAEWSLHDAIAQRIEKSELPKVTGKRPTAVAQVVARRGKRVTVPGVSFALEDGWVVAPFEAGLTSATKGESMFTVARTTAVGDLGNEAACARAAKSVDANPDMRTIASSLIDIAAGKGCRVDIALPAQPTFSMTMVFVSPPKGAVHQLMCIGENDQRAARSECERMLATATFEAVAK